MDSGVSPAAGAVVVAEVVVATAVGCAVGVVAPPQARTSATKAKVMKMNGPGKYRVSYEFFS
jgi:hypothetical protein